MLRLQGELRICGEERQRLELQLDEARSAILEQLISPAARRLIDGYQSINALEALADWRRSVEERAIEAATPSELTPLGTRYAVCPLCGAAPQGRYAPGFVYPDGLRRHLEGWRPAPLCPVIREATAVARTGINHRNRKESAPLDVQTTAEAQRKVEELFEALRYPPRKRKGVRSDS